MHTLYISNTTHELEPGESGLPPFHPLSLATKAEYITRQVSNPLHVTKTNRLPLNKFPRERVKTFLEAKVERQLPSVWNFQDGVVIVGIKSERDCSRMIDLIDQWSTTCFYTCPRGSRGRPKGHAFGLASS